MKRTAFLLLVLGLTSVLIAKVSLVSQRGTELIVQYNIEPWEIVSEGDFSRIVAKNMDYSSVSGAPLIPYDEFKIGLPPSGDYSYSILESQSKTVELPSRLLPVPTISFIDGLSNYAYNADEEQYLPSRSQSLNALEQQNFRGYAYVPIQINPFNYDGNKGLQVFTSMLIRIELSGNLNFRSIEPSDAPADIMLEQFVNREQAKLWREQNRSTVNYSPFGSSDYWMRIETNRDGMYRINPSQLSEFPLQDIDPRQFRIFSTSGKVASRMVVQPGPEFLEIPILVSGESDGSFDANDYILFYGRSRDDYEQNTLVQQDPLYYNPYSQNQVFWLSFGSGFSGTAQRINLLTAEANFNQVLVSTPAIKHVESETQRRDDTGFTWFGSRWFGNSTAEYQLQTEISDLAPVGTQQLSFRLRKEGSSGSMNHTINVEVNGSPLGGNFNWSGTGFYTFSQPLYGFVNGVNTIKVKVVRTTSDNLFFDWLRLTYPQNLQKGSSQKLVSHPDDNSSTPHRFDLSGNLSGLLVFRANGIYDVQQLPMQGQFFISAGDLGTRYMLLDPSEAYSPALVQIANPTDLTADNSQMDNLIVSPAEFEAQAQALAQQYWDVYGVRSRVVLQDDIFNQFNGGHPDPSAIRQAVRYYYHNLPTPRISSLTLLGMGTIDWRNFSGAALAKNKIMVWQGDSSTSVDYMIASDDYYGMINNGNYSEVAIGRYPVKTQNELDIMLQNFSNYTTNPSPGWWRNSMVFLGDDLNNGPSTYEYIHTQQAEEAGNMVNPSIQADKIFALEYEYDEFQNKPKAREDMFAAINEGRLLWCYIGHGSFDKLGAEDYLNGATDMGRFNNTGKQPLMIASSCSVSHFDYWGYESLGQKVVLQNNVGAIASYAAMRISYPDNNQPMLLLLLNSLANKRNPLGYSVMDAKIRYTGNNNNDFVYTLLGDPVLRVLTPERDSTMQVTGTEANGVLHSRETATIQGTFGASQVSGETEIKVFGPDKSYYLGPGTLVSHRGSQLYLGSADVSSSQYEAGFIVPDDISSGTKGLAVSYLWNAAEKKDYINFMAPLEFSDSALAIENSDLPRIDIYLGSYDFRAGDTVSTKPTLYAKISDANGINITGSAGHNILLIIDNSLQPLSITPFFAYDKGSFTAGTITYPLPQLSEGMHSLQVVAFDNFNQPSVASTQFVAKESSELSLERLLVYPNPIQSEGQITFILSEDAELSIGIYTMRGKRIRNIKANARQGFNAISFDGRDEQGTRLANNTYFLKVKAKTAAGVSIEKTEKLVMYK